MEKQGKDNAKIGWKPLLAGLLTGLANGLFGAGGGMVAVAALGGLCKLESHKAHAGAIAIMLPLTAMSSVIYAFRGSVDWRALLYTAPGLLLGSLLGAKLLGRLKTAWLDGLFSLLMLVAAGWLLLS